MRVAGGVGRESAETEVVTGERRRRRRWRRNWRERMGKERCILWDFLSVWGRGRLERDGGRRRIVEKIDDVVTEVDIEGNDVFTQTRRNR